MYISELLDRLFDIERSIDVENSTVIRNKVLDAEECVLRIQNEISEVLHIISASDGCRDRFPSLALLLRIHKRELAEKFRSHARRM